MLDEPEWNMGSTENPEDEQLDPNLWDNEAKEGEMDEDIVALNLRCRQGNGAARPEAEFDDDAFIEALDADSDPHELRWGDEDEDVPADGNASAAAPGEPTASAAAASGAAAATAAPSSRARRPREPAAPAAAPKLSPP